MYIAVEGCAHGELGNIYATLEASPQPPQLLICCGDFQSVRNGSDLTSLAAPQQHRRPGDFHLYYSGERKAPILTIFIGGNHEASSFLQELPYGGWVAPNIYYLGNAGVINVAGIRIAGISGIYKGHDYMKGHFEISPYTESTKRSVYHIRNIETFRLKQLSGNLNICLSHDWPRGIVYHGDMDKLLSRKPYFREDIENGSLGSAPCEELLFALQPEYWFAAHMHCHFPAIVPHKNDTQTKFLALDKCLPRRRFLQILEIPHDENKPIRLEYDLEWLTILRLTNHLLNVRQTTCYMPKENLNDRYDFTPTDDEKAETLNSFNGDLVIPIEFSMTAKPFDAESNAYFEETQGAPSLNPQTVNLCDRLKIDDPVGLIALQNGTTLLPYVPSEPAKPENQTDEIALDEDLPIESVQPIITPLQLPTPRLSLPEPVNNTIDDSIDSNAPEADDKVEDTHEFATPSKRTFKRRNESLYKSYSEDD